MRGRPDALQHAVVLLDLHRELRPLRRASSADERARPRARRCGLGCRRRTVARPQRVPISSDNKPTPAAVEPQEARLANRFRGNGALSRGAHQLSGSPVRFGHRTIVERDRRRPRLPGKCDSGADEPIDLDQLDMEGEGRNGPCCFMTTMLVTETTRPTPRPITVALVNNMPDSAFVDTENQFRRAAEGPDCAGVNFDLYTITEIPRSEAIAEVIESRYLGLDDLSGAAAPVRPDRYGYGAGAVSSCSTSPTGPPAPSLPAAAVGRRGGIDDPAVVSRGAHGRLLLFDGIAREPLSSKWMPGCSTEWSSTPQGQLATGLPDTVAVPHSRVNDVPEAALDQGGLTDRRGSCRSAPRMVGGHSRPGADRACCVQGHPEYSTKSLLREYRRDVRRRALYRDGGSLPTRHCPTARLRPEGRRRVWKISRERASNGSGRGTR